MVAWIVRLEAQDGLSVTLAPDGITYLGRSSFPIPTGFHTQCSRKQLSIHTTSSKDGFPPRAVLWSLGMNPIRFKQKVDMRIDSDVSTCAEPCGQLILPRGSSAALQNGDQFFLAPGCLLTVHITKQDSLTDLTISIPPTDAEIDGDAPAMAGKRADSEDRICSVDWTAAEEAKVADMDSVVISSTGYRGEEKWKVIAMAEFCGVQYMGEFDARKCTHLICQLHSGPKYSLASRTAGIHIVNHRWLEDTISRRARQLEASYSSVPGEQAGPVQIPHAMASHHLKDRKNEHRYGECRRSPLPVNTSQQKSTEFPQANNGSRLKSAHVEGGQEESTGFLNHSGRVGISQRKSNIQEMDRVNSSTAGIFQLDARLPLASNSNSKTSRNFPGNFHLPPNKSIGLAGQENSIKDLETSRKQAPKASKRQLVQLGHTNVKRSRQLETSNDDGRWKSAAPDPWEASKQLLDDDDGIQLRTPNRKVKSLRGSESGFRTGSRLEIGSSQSEFRSGVQQKGWCGDVKEDSRKIPPSFDRQAGSVPFAEVEVRDSCTRRGEDGLGEGKGTPSTNRGTPGGKGCACVICREEEIGGTAGSLTCGHLFCFGCILRWSNLTKGRLPQCPLCKVPFDFITKIETSMAGDVSESVVMVTPPGSTWQPLNRSVSAEMRTRNGCPNCQAGPILMEIASTSRLCHDCGVQIVNRVSDRRQSLDAFLSPEFNAANVELQARVDMATPMGPVEGRRRSTPLLDNGPARAIDFGAVARMISLQDAEMEGVTDGRGPTLSMFAALRSGRGQ